jgi:hypothetical protein
MCCLPVPVSAVVGRSSSSTIAISIMILLVKSSWSKTQSLGPCCKWL